MNQSLSNQPDSSVGPASAAAQPISSTAKPAPAPSDGAGPSAASTEHHEKEHIHWGRLLQRRLLIRVTLPTLIGIVQLVFAVVAVTGGNTPARILLWMFPAIIAGYVFGRITKIAWAHEGTQIALVRGQILITVAYILVRIGTKIALNETLGDRVNLADVLLVLSFGFFLGRTLGLADQIWQALSSRHSQPAVAENPAGG
ncbi:MAG: hypothetical protein AB7R89_22255 [Dehalococcoidia bacterium]